MAKNEQLLLEMRAMIFKDTGKKCSSREVFERASRLHRTKHEDAYDVAFIRYQIHGTLPGYVRRFHEAILRKHTS